MKKLKQTGILIFTIAIILFLTSCLKDQVPRTEEMELGEIDAYLANLILNGHDVDTTELGIYYVVREVGEGLFPKQGDTLTIGYSGYFIDGNLFESTALTTEGSYTFNFIDKPLIPGFEDGLKLMNKGALLELIIPSKLAYGATGTLSIPSYSTLIFVTEMKDIKPVITGN